MALRISTISRTQKLFDKSVNYVSTPNTSKAKPKKKEITECKKKPLIVRTILFYVISINWILGGIVMIFNIAAMNDIRLFFITFLFGLYGHLMYIFD